MPKRLSSICLFLAWLCASGALLDTVQVFAWARMFAGYARTMSVVEAAIETMDPGKPCPICLAVRRARDSQRPKQPAVPPASVARMLLVPVQNEPFVLPSIRPEWPEAVPVAMASWLTPVSVPPPRAPNLSLVG